MSASFTAAFALSPAARAADPDARAGWAASVPRLSVGAVLGHAADPLAGRGLLVGGYARLSWPLGAGARPRATMGGPTPGVVERMAELRRRLEELRRSERTLERALDVEETEAELRALDGALP